MSASVKGLDVIRSTLRKLRDISAVKGLRVTVPPAAEKTIAFLAAGGRDLTTVTPTLRAEVDAAVAKGVALVAKGSPAGTPWQLAAEAVLRRLRLRVAQGGADASFKPDAASTVKQKGHSRLFVNTGKLLRDLSGSKSITVRTVK